jgi:hypothetical protein
LHWIWEIGATGFVRWEEPHMPDIERWFAENPPKDAGF